MMLPATAAPPGPPAALPGKAQQAGQRPDKVADAVRRFAADVAAERRAGRSGEKGGPLLSADRGGRIGVALWSGSPVTAERRAAVRGTGATITAEHSADGAGLQQALGLVQALVPHQRLDDVAALGWVTAVTPPGGDGTDVGDQLSEGVALHRADDVQARGVDGTGVDVGVISDGVTSLADSQASGDLPAAVTVLDAGSADEGTAMLEIVHDTAPGAGLLFHGTGDGVAGHASAMDDLVAAGADVITEDIPFDAEPAFQKGFLADKGDAVAAAGVPVHSSAGNLGARHTARVPAAGTGTRPDGTTGTFTGCTNTPDDVVAIAPSDDTTFDVQLTGGRAMSATLQWSEPRAVYPTAGQGGFTNLDLYLMDAGLTRCLAQSTAVQGAGMGDTLEQLSFTAASNRAAKLVVDVQGTTPGAPVPTLDLRFRGGVSAVDTPTRAGSLNPDSNYTGDATSAAAVDAGTVSGGFGALEGFSAAGPVTLFLTAQCPGGAAGPCVPGPGTASVPARGPAWAAADGVSVTGVGGFGSPFFGTSASAPHAAACDALLRDHLGTPAAAPATTNARLAATAGDIAPAGPDDVTGAGQLDCLAAVNSPPVADAGGPYATVEGTDRALSAAGSTDPDPAEVLSYAWDLDGDGVFDDSTSATPLFTLVGQDAVRTVAVRVTDSAGASSTDSATVTTANVAPAVTVDPVASLDEGGSAVVTGTVTDPGWLDPLTATVDVGDGAGPQPLTGVLDSARPDATLTYQTSHAYGDDGTFPVTVCGRDDDTTTCVTQNVVVRNVAPTAALDESGTVLVGGAPTFVLHSGVPLSLSGRSTDPGSDDLRLTWDWDDGAPSPDVTVTSLVDPPGTDPASSPSVEPRDVSDAQVHAFTGACRYDIGFASRDDDGGTASDVVTALVTGNASRNRTAGYWAQQFQTRNKPVFTPGELACLLEVTGYVSTVFDELRAASTVPQAARVLDPPSSISTTEQFDRQLLAALLNFANGATDLTTPVDTTGDGVADTTFLAAVTTAEAVRLSPTATSAELVAQKDALERINLRHGG